MKTESVVKTETKESYRNAIDALKDVVSKFNDEVSAFRQRLTEKAKKANTDIEIHKRKLHEISARKIVAETLEDYKELKKISEEERSESQNLLLAQSRAQLSKEKIEEQVNFAFGIKARSILESKIAKEAYEKAINRSKLVAAEIVDKKAQIEAMKKEISKLESEIVQIANGRELQYVLQQTAKISGVMPKDESISADLMTLALNVIADNGEAVFEKKEQIKKVSVIPDEVVKKINGEPVKTYNYERADV